MLLLRFSNQQMGKLQRQCIDVLADYGTSEDVRTATKGVMSACSREEWDRYTKRAKKGEDNGQEN